MRKPVSVRRQKQNKDQATSINQTNEKTQQNIDVNILEQVMLEKSQRFQIENSVLLEKIDLLLLQQKSITHSLVETEKSQLELQQLINSLQKELSLLQQTQLSVADLVQAIFSKIGKLSLLTDIQTDIKALKSIGRDDYKTILNILLNKKQDQDTERTISFQLGKTLIDGKKSIENLLNLPNKLVALKEDAKSRKAKNILSLDIEKSKVNKEQKNKRIEIKNILHDESKDLKILSVISTNLFGILKNKFIVNYLLEDNETQIKNSTANLFVLETCYSVFNDLWKYALYSQNKNHPKTKKLINSILSIKNKGVGVVLLDNSLIGSYEKFDLFRKLSDKIYACSPQVFEKLKDEGLIVEKINNFFNSKKYNIINRFDSSNNIMFLGEYLTNKNELNESSKVYLIKLLQLGGCVYKGKDVDSPLYDGIEVTSTIDSFNNDEILKCIKSNDLVFHLSNEKQDFLSSQLMSYMGCAKTVITNITDETNEVKDFVFQVSGVDELEKTIEKLKTDKWLRVKRGHLGYRYVMENHSSNLILDKIKGNYNSRPRKISVMMATRREHYSDRIIKNLTSQVYENIEIIIVTQNWSEQGIKRLEDTLLSSNKFSKVKIIPNNTDITLGERLNICSQHVSIDSEYLAKMDDDDFYFENYLRDMVLPFSYGNFAMVGKAENFIYLESSNKLVLTREDRAANREMNFVAGPTLIIKRQIFEKIGGFKPVNNGEDSDLIKRVLELNMKVYSSDIFNFVQFRSKDATNHTWQVKARFLKNHVHLFLMALMNQLL